MEAGGEVYFWGENVIESGRVRLIKGVYSTQSTSMSPQWHPSLEFENTKKPVLLFLSINV